MFGRSPKSRKDVSRNKHLESEMATAVREACDAATADMAREKWLELELERQRQLADASTEQLACAEKDKHQLMKRVKQLESSLDQHETYAKLEAQGAQHVELEMRKMRVQLKERSVEVRALQQQLEDARQQIRADEKAGAAFGAATNAALESHRKLLRQLFALVVRGSLAVQSLNDAMQRGPEGQAYYPAGIQQCMEVLEALISMRHTCAELLSAGGLHSETLADLTRAATEAAAKSAAAAAAAAQQRQPMRQEAPWQGAYSCGGATPPSAAAAASRHSKEYLPPPPAAAGPPPSRGYLREQMAPVPETYPYSPATASDSYQHSTQSNHSHCDYGYTGSSAAAPVPSPRNRSNYQQQEQQHHQGSYREEQYSNSRHTASSHRDDHDSCNGRTFHSSFPASLSTTQKIVNLLSPRSHAYRTSATDSLYSNVPSSHAAGYFNGERRSSRHAAEDHSSSSRSVTGVTPRTTGLEALKAAAQLRQASSARRYTEAPYTQHHEREYGSERAYSKTTRTYEDLPAYGVRSAGSMSQVQIGSAAHAGERSPPASRKWFW